MQLNNLISGAQKRTDAQSVAPTGEFVKCKSSFIGLTRMFTGFFPLFKCFN
jgi:hypothetical protein